MIEKKNLMRNDPIWDKIQVWQSNRGIFFSLKKSMLKIMEKISCAHWQVSDHIYIALNE